MYVHKDKEIREILRERQEVDEAEILRILTKAENLKELTLREVFALLEAEENPALIEKVFSTARRLRNKVIGKVIYLPVPLYVSNYCQNDCLYCSFRRSNQIKRKRMTKQELVEEVRYLTSNGFKIIELVFGEDSFFTPQKLSSYIKAAKKELDELSEIVLNIAPTDTKGFRLLRNAGVERIVQWQETYDPKRYARVHPVGKKNNFNFRLQTYERMLDAGIKNIGIGVLFGLSDYRYDVLSLIQHVNYLKGKYEVSPIIGIPRLKYAEGGPYKAKKFGVTDNQLKLIVAVFRLALPYSNIFVSTRENIDLMLDLLDCGGGALLATQCSVSIGYKQKDKTTAQFKVYSYESSKINRTLKEKGFIPSYKKPRYNLV